MLTVGVLPMPYGYYQLLRWVALLLIWRIRSGRIGKPSRRGPSPKNETGSGEEDLFKLLYLISPIVSVVLAAKGHAIGSVVTGIGCSMLMLLLDSAAVALRGIGLLGFRHAFGFFLKMLPTTIAMIVPAAIWNSVGFGLGRLLSAVIR
jgi:hypothetical protein